MSTARAPVEPDSDPAVVEPLAEADPLAEAEAETVQPVEPPDHGAVTASSPPAKVAPAAGSVPVVIGIEACDEYLSLYERCEEILEPLIMAGDMRAADAEKGWLEYIAGTPERAALPESCAAMLAELRLQCPLPEREAGTI